MTDELFTAAVEGMLEGLRDNPSAHTAASISGIASAALAAIAALPRSCTGHPDDNPPKPCPRKYALQDCRAAAKVRDTEPMGKTMAALNDLAASSVFSKEGGSLFKDAAELIGELICLHASSIPVADAVEHILDDKSAWIAAPSKEVAQAVALRAVVAAQQIAQETEREWSAALPRSTEGEPAAWQYRWKIDGAWTDWCAKSYMDGYTESFGEWEKRPLYLAPVLTAAPSSGAEQATSTSTVERCVAAVEDLKLWDKEGMLHHTQLAAVHDGALNDAIKAIRALAAPTADGEVDNG